MRRFELRRAARVRRTSWLPAYSSLFLLLVIESAQAQTAQDVFNIFGGLVKSAMQQAVQAEWKKLPLDEVNCVDQQLQRQQSSIRALIDAGVYPSDTRIASARAACRSTAAQQTPQQVRGSSVYEIDKVRLGDQLQIQSAEYQEYRCGPSEQFAGFSWCQKKRDMREARGPFVSTWSVLHSSTGVVAYVSRSLDPAFFGPREVDDDISRLTRKHGASPRIQQMPSNSLGMQGTMAIWGDLELEQLDQSNLRELAAGRQIKAGFLVDHLGNFQQSAQLGLPMYRVARGAGYVWVGNWNQAGRGNLRFFAVDRKLLSQPGVGAAGTSTDQSVQDNVAATLAKEELERQRKALEEAERKRLAEAAAAKAATEEAERQRKAAVEAEERRRIEADAAKRAALEIERQKAAAEEARLLLERERARNSTILWSIGGLGAISLALFATYMSFRSRSKRAGSSETAAVLSPSFHPARDSEQVSKIVASSVESTGEAVSNKNRDTHAIEEIILKEIERVETEEAAIADPALEPKPIGAAPPSAKASDALAKQFAELNKMHSEGLLTAQELLEFKSKLSLDGEKVPERKSERSDSMSNVWVWVFALNPVWGMALHLAIVKSVASEGVAEIVSFLGFVSLNIVALVKDYRQISQSYGKSEASRVFLSALVLAPLYPYCRARLVKSGMYLVWVWIGSCAGVVALVLRYSDWA